MYGECILVGSRLNIWEASGLDTDGQVGNGWRKIWDKNISKLTLFWRDNFAVVYRMKIANSRLSVFI